VLSGEGVLVLRVRNFFIFIFISFSLFLIGSNLNKQIDASVDRAHLTVLAKLPLDVLVVFDLFADVVVAQELLTSHPDLPAHALRTVLGGLAALQSKAVSAGMLALGVVVAVEPTLEHLAEVLAVAQVPKVHLAHVAVDVSAAQTVSGVLVHHQSGLFVLADLFDGLQDALSVELGAQLDVDADAVFGAVDEGLGSLQLWELSLLGLS
jgi:hypothetical protein